MTGPKRTLPAATPSDGDASTVAQPALGPGPDSELTWLLHRAAQRMRSATSEAAEKHGVTLRHHILLSALHLSPGMTQVELGRAVGMDKTTLTNELDQLARLGLVNRAIDPRDRRARTLAVTEKGEHLRRLVSAATERAERTALDAFGEAEVALLRRILYALLDGTHDRGTCL